MIETLSVPDEQEQVQSWSQHLQRRVLRLLMLHNRLLFRNQFRHFYEKSEQPHLPLFQQYDRYIKLQALSSELLDDIMPRIRRRLSMHTSHTRLREEAPTRGDIDWPRTIERGYSVSPGLPPLQFETRLRRRTQETPENLLVVAILLAYRREIQRTLEETFADEVLQQQEQQDLARMDAQAERELAAPYARALSAQAQHMLNERTQHSDIDALSRHVLHRLPPGVSPYRDLVAWWRRFRQFRTGRATAEQAPIIASQREDETVEAWLYELWIALEIIHLLATEGALQAQDMRIATDLLQCTFTWQQRRFRFIYNRQLDTSTTFEPGWEHGPATRPDYTIERERPLEIRYNNCLIWREPSFVMDAKYYLAGSDPARTHGPVKKLLGDMTLLGAHASVLFFPRLPEPQSEQQATRIIQHSGQQYLPPGEGLQQVHLYHIEPAMPFDRLQQRLHAVLDLACSVLPERPTPVCCGIWPDRRTINASQRLLPTHTILCPKPHIGPHAFDLVNVEVDCLKNPRLCHVIGQDIIPPFIKP